MWQNSTKCLRCILYITVAPNTLSPSNPMLICQAAENLQYDDVVYVITVAIGNLNLCC